jgi:hypothetical protein
MLAQVSIGSKCHLKFKPILYAFKFGQFHPRLASGFAVSVAAFITELRKRKKDLKKMKGGNGTKGGAWTG